MNLFHKAARWGTGQITWLKEQRINGLHALLAVTSAFLFALLIGTQVGPRSRFHGCAHPACQPCAGVRPRSPWRPQTAAGPPPCDPSSAFATPLAPALARPPFMCSDPRPPMSTPRASAAAARCSPSRCATTSDTPSSRAKSAGTSRTAATPSSGAHLPRTPPPHEPR